MTYPDASACFENHVHISPRYQSHLRRQHEDFDLHSTIAIRVSDGCNGGEERQEEKEIPMNVVEDGLLNEERL